MDAYEISNYFSQLRIADGASQNNGTAPYKMDEHDISKHFSQLSITDVAQHDQSSASQSPPFYRTSQTYSSCNDMLAFDLTEAEEVWWKDYVAKRLTPNQYEAIERERSLIFESYHFHINIYLKERDNAGRGMENATVEIKESVANVCDKMYRAIIQDHDMRMQALAGKERQFKEFNRQQEEKQAFGPGIGCSIGC